MAKYSATSKERLESCTPLLQAIFRSVIVNGYDHTILEGHRGKEEQNNYFEAGKSQIKWPDGKHNKFPSEAVDAVPYPIKWADTDPKVQEVYWRQMAHFAGHVQAVAWHKFGVSLRWGGDWDKDFSLMDNRFNDYPHFEIVR